MKNFIKHTLLLVALMLFCANASVYSQDVKQLTKQYKNVIKQLKKQHSLKNVTIVVEPNGYWYFLLQNKYSEKFGVATQDGNVVVPAKYDKIEYYPELPAGVSKFPSYESTGVINLESSHETRSIQSLATGQKVKELTENDYLPYKKAEFELYHPQVPSIFVATARKESCVYNVNGTLLLSAKGALKYYGGYIFKGVYEPLRSTCFSGSHSKWHTQLSLFQERTNCYSLYIADGTCLIESACDIDINDKGICKYSKKENQMEVRGAFLLNDRNNCVPCEFRDVQYSYKGKWEVKKNANSPFEEYSVGDELKARFRDKGEEYYEQRNYDAVIEYYAMNGVSAPWAKFFTGASLCKKAFTHIIRCESACETLEKGSAVGVNHNFNLQEAEEQLALSLSLLEIYVQEDSTYLSNAEGMMESIKEAIEQMPQLSMRYDSAIKKQSAAEAAAMRQQQEQQAYQQQAIQKMVNSISQSLSQIISGSGVSSSRPQNNYGGYSSGGGYSNTNGAGSSSVSNESASQRDNTDQLIYWERKKRDTEKLIENTRERLAKDPGNSRIKRQLESQEELLRTCNETLNRMNSK